MHDSDPLAFMNGFRQISTRRNVPVITSTNKEIAAGLNTRLDALRYLVNVMWRTRSLRRPNQVSPACCRRHGLL